ncbi:hypothetical protein EI546_11430 [Aequorivita sp. H23M31]|uniref:Phage holin family protein n=1 Tax=Aequorivita ciconiae TaxID=2494375 RepID=A0A410G4T6_9FLAO|nr:phage holin family protein [Aequorivita sp. H23M31]QAA82292.1 hypothetical protein EI546_11430 [Aequorivita sp. H23M31]
MFEDLSKSLHNVTDRIEDFGLSTIEYYKLRLFKSSMKGAISLVNLLVYGSLSLFVMLFLSVGAALWLATFFEQAFIGFLLVGGFYGLLLIFMFVFGRKIIARTMLYNFSSLLYDEDDIEPKEAARQEVEEFVALKKEEIREEISE